MARPRPTVGAGDLVADLEIKVGRARLPGAAERSQRRAGGRRFRAR